MRHTLYHAPGTEDRAREYSAWCELRRAQEPPRLSSGFALWLDAQGLALLSSGHTPPFRLTADMLNARLRGRSLLVQACGRLPGQTVLDPFGGFGLDALVLASRGAMVTLYEDNTLVWLLQREFSQRMAIDVQSHLGDGTHVLEASTERWDIVYLDPMFPVRSKTALPNLGLQHLQALTAGAEVDLPEVAALARRRARAKVVLKRRRKDPVFERPGHQLKGQKVRFDIYV